MERFIKIRGPEGAKTGYFVPRLYSCSRLDKFAWKVFGLDYVKDMFKGWTYWWVRNDADFINAIKTLDQLKKTRMFEYKIVE